MTRPGSTEAYDRLAVPLFGLPFDPVTMDDAVGIVRNAATAGRRLWLSTANLDWIVMCRKDPAFAATVLRSDLVTCDGAPLWKLSALAGVPLPQRVTGSDLFDRLRTEDGSPLRTYFFGGRDGAADGATSALTDAPGGLVAAGGHNPGFGSLDELSTPAHLDRVNASAADFLIVALGASKGQHWLDRNRDALDAPVIAHLGAVVDFAAGGIARAPKLLQDTHLEWAWRIGQDPQLWRRYAGDAAILPTLFREALAQRRLLQALSAMNSGRANAEWRGPVLSLSGRFGRADVPVLARALTDAETAEDGLTIECSMDFAPCPEAVALFMIARQRFADRHLSFEMDPLGAHVRGLLQLHHVPLSSRRPNNAGKRPSPMGGVVDVSRDRQGEQTS